MINQIIYKIQQGLSTHPKLRTWIWFITLCLGGLLFVLALSYTVKGIFFFTKLLTQAHYLEILEAYVV